jgi:hypothetical protein
MVPRVEEQMHQALIAQEEERCKKLESDHEKSEETRGKKVKRRAIARPWTRPAERSLCERADLLMLVTQYDYDLADESFLNHCEARGVLHVAGVPGSRRWEFFSDYGKLKSEYLADPYFQFAEKSSAKQYRYTDREMDSGWEIIVLGRATLQDCWQVYGAEPGMSATTP